MQSRDAIEMMSDENYEWTGPYLSWAAHKTTAHTHNRTRISGARIRQDWNQHTLQWVSLDEIANSDTISVEFSTRLFDYSRINESNTSCRRVGFRFVLANTNDGALIRLFESRTSQKVQLIV
jgi:hypothetical protein